MEKKESSKPFKPQIYERRGRRQNIQNFGNRDRGRTFNGDRQIFRSNNREQSQNRQCGNDNRGANYRCQNYSRNDNRDRGRQNLSLISRGNRRYNSSKANLGTRSRSNSRVTKNRQN